MLFDQFFGAAEQRHWNSEAERLSGRRTGNYFDELAPSHRLPGAQDKASERLKLAHFKVPRLMFALGVKSGHRSKSGQCPLYPQKRTLELILEMSALCQKQTFRAAERTSLFDHLVGAQ
jgi:hypothetical protein